MEDDSKQVPTDFKVDQTAGGGISFGDVANPLDISEMSFKKKEVLYKQASSEEPVA